MKTNRSYFFSGLLAIFLLATSAGILKDNGKAGNTGSPNENNCTQCHSSFAANTGGGSMVISSTIPATGYVPGTVYTISATVSRNTMSVFGLGVECLSATNISTGTFAITNASETHLLTAANQRKNVVHQLNGGLTANTKTFQFNWTAPAAGTGTVTFYGSGIAGNNNGSENGDYNYTTTLTAAENTGGVAIEPTFTEKTLSIFPNPASDWLNVQAKNSNITNISIFDINGKKVTEAKANENTTLFVKNLPSGLYYVQALNKENNVVAVQQFVKE